MGRWAVTERKESIHWNDSAGTSIIDIFAYVVRGECCTRRVGSEPTAVVMLHVVGAYLFIRKVRLTSGRNVVGGL